MNPDAWIEKAKEKHSLYEHFLHNKRESFRSGTVDKKTLDSLKFCRDEIDSLFDECPDGLLSGHVELQIVNEEIDEILKSLAPEEKTEETKDEDSSEKREDLSETRDSSSSSSDNQIPTGEQKKKKKKKYKKKKKKSDQPKEQPQKVPSASAEDKKEEKKTEENNKKDEVRTQHFERVRQLPGLKKKEGWQKRLTLLKFNNLHFLGYPVDEKKDAEFKKNVEEATETKKLLQDLAGMFTAIWSYDKGLSQVHDEVKQAYWYPIFERSGKDAKYAEDILRAAQPESEKTAPTLELRFERKLKELERMCKKQADNSAYGRAMAYMSKHHNYCHFVNPGVTYQDFRPILKTLLRGRFFASKNTFQACGEHGLVDVTPYVANHVYGIIRVNLDNGDPAGRLATDHPMQWMDYMKNVADGKEKEENLPIIFTDEKKREAFWGTIKSKEFKGPIESFRDADELFDSAELEGEKNKNNYTWPFLVDNGYKGKARKCERFLVCFETNDDKGVEMKVKRGDIKIVRIQDYPYQTWTTFAHADYVFRPGRPYRLEGKTLSSHPHQKLYEWFLKNTDDLFYVKPLEITEASYAQISEELKIDCKSHKDNPFPQTAFKKLEEWTVETAEMIRKGQHKDEEMREKMRWIGKSFADENQSLPERMADELKEIGYGWVRCVDDVLRTLLPWGFWMVQTLNPESPQRTFFEMHMNSHRAAISLSALYFLFSYFGNSGKTARTSLEKSIWKDLVSLLAKEVFIKSQQGAAGTATTALNALVGKLIGYINELDTRSEVDAEKTKNLTDDVYRALRLLYHEEKDEKISIGIYIMINLVELVFPCDPAIEKRIIAMSTPVYWFTPNQAQLTARSKGRPHKTAQKLGMGTEEGKAKFYLELHGSHKRILKKYEQLGEERDEFFSIQVLYRRMGDLLHHRYTQIPMPKVVMQQTKEFLDRGNKVLLTIKDNCIKLDDHVNRKQPPTHGSTIGELFENFKKCYFDKNMMKVQAFKEQMIYLGLYEPAWDNCEDSDNNEKTRAMVVYDPIKKAYIQLPWEEYKDFLEPFLVKVQEGKSEDVKEKIERDFHQGNAAKRIHAWQKAIDVFASKQSEVEEREEEEEKEEKDNKGAGEEDAKADDAEFSTAELDKLGEPAEETKEHSTEEIETEMDACFANIKEYFSTLKKTGDKAAMLATLETLKNLGKRKAEGDTSESQKKRQMREKS